MILKNIFKKNKYFLGEHLGLAYKVLKEVINMNDQNLEVLNVLKSWMIFNQVEDEYLMDALIQEFKEKVFEFKAEYDNLKNVFAVEEAEEKRIHMDSNAKEVLMMFKSWVVFNHPELDPIVNGLIEEFDDNYEAFKVQYDDLKAVFASTND